MSVRAKFVVQSYETRLDRSGDGAELRTVKLTAVYSDTPENKKFFRWTPNGTIEIGVLNPEAWKQFELGKEYYVDFTPAFVRESDESQNPQHDAEGHHD